ncbi:unnamed protein product, partial [Rotaria magnacalcarata]
KLALVLCSVLRDRDRYCERH